MKKYRFHMIGYVHLPTSELYNSCAFTQKNIKLIKMLRALGHEVILYGAEGSDDIASKFVQTHTLKEIRDIWGEGDNRFDVGYNWKENLFKHDFNDPPTALTQRFYKKVIEEINKTKYQDDFLLVMQGYYQKPIADAVKLYLTVEPGIGYRGSYAKYRVFESHYIQYFTYGSENPRGDTNGNYYDRVIPNYFDPADFPFVEKKEDYLLYIGRLIIRKGVNTAVKVAEATATKLKVAGQEDDETKFLGLDSPLVERVGYADKKSRSELMGKAKAVFVPTIYLEPFGGVAAEAMLCGTPVITTNFGAFTDYNIDGLTGYKCNTLRDFIDASKKVIHLSPKDIHNYAVEKFSMETVKWDYQRWFEDLYALWESSVDDKKKGWHRL